MCNAGLGALTGLLGLAIGTRRKYERIVTESARNVLELEWVSGGRKTRRKCRYTRSGARCSSPVIWIGVVVVHVRYGDSGMAPQVVHGRHFRLGLKPKHEASGDTCDYFAPVDKREGGHRWIMGVSGWVQVEHMRRAPLRIKMVLTWRAEQDVMTLPLVHGMVAAEQMLPRLFWHQFLLGHLHGSPCHGREVPAQGAVSE